VSGQLYEETVTYIPTINTSNVISTKIEIKPESSDTGLKNKLAMLKQMKKDAK
jgi:hypothetical protein